MNSFHYNEYLKKFWEQKRLEEYQQRRKLARPKTTKFYVALYCVLLLALLLVVFIMLFFLKYSLWLRFLIAGTYIVIIAEMYGRFLAIKFVECYQHYASEEKRRNCKCIPSCSEYAILCLKKYELLYALIKIRKRLFVTCKGFDFIIDDP